MRKFPINIRFPGENMSSLHSNYSSTGIYRRITPLAIILLCLAAGCIRKDSSPSAITAQRGVIDLASRDFKKNGAMPLSGEWEFYWNALYGPEDFSGKNPPPPEFAKLPGVWTGTQYKNSRLPDYGFATYRLKIITGPPSRNMGLRFYTLSTAFRLFANGNLIASAGTVGTSARGSKAAYFPQVAHIPFGTGDIDLVLQVSNYDYRAGGPWRNIWFGPEKELYREKFLKTLGTMFLFGCLFVMGIHYLVLYRYRTRDFYFLVFSLICFLISARSMASGEYLLAQIFPGINFNLLIKTEYLSYYITMPVIALFFRSIFPAEMPKAGIWIITTISSLFSLFVLVTTSGIFTRSIFAYYVFTYALILYLLVVLLGAIRHNRPGAWMMFFGGFILALSTVNDSLYASFIIRTGNMIDMGLLAFIIIQSVVLSKKFTATFSEVENLSGKLSELNLNLETQVTERTRELQDAYETIKEVSIKDPLTGCYNRRYIHEQLPREIERAIRHNHPISVILCDIDHFKAINDTHGHPAGDRVLVEFISIIQSSIRDSADWIGRYGGEEFLIVLPETPPSLAMLIAERIRGRTMDHAISSGLAEISFTASFGITGIAAHDPNHALTQELIFQKADEMLYRAKQGGRNMAVCGSIGSDTTG